MVSKRKLKAKKMDSELDDPSASESELRVDIDEGEPEETLTELMSAKERVETLKEKIKDFPKQPGVYLMLNEKDKIIYVGKAKSLRNRVRSYFQSSKNMSPKTKFLVKQIRSIEYQLTKTEVEAFLLEASLIKKNRPKYNVRLKDDKAYPYLRISMKDNFPRIYLSRRVKQDGSLYFGPYTSSYAVRGTIQFLSHNLKIRDCKDSDFKTRKRPCMTYQIRRCEAPCVGLVDEKSYQKNLDKAVRFLNGEESALQSDLEALMMSEADAERFESAARIRDSLKAIRNILDQQQVISTAPLENMDVICFAGDERGTLVQFVHLRKKRVIGQRYHFLNRVNWQNPLEDPREWLVSFLNQYYGDNIIPDVVATEIDLGHDMNRLLEDVLKEKSGRSIRLRFAGDEESKKGFEIGKKSAEKNFDSYMARSGDKLAALARIQTKLHVSELPSRIECYDISNFQGSENVASQVVFEDGEPAVSEYRKYKIKTVDGQNDFESMKEVLSRRFKHTEWPDPQLILVDGGKGQLSMALKALQEVGRDDIAIASIAKARTQSNFKADEVYSTEERFFLPGRSNPVKFSKYSEEYKILTGLRDEAHRFAIEFHRKRREKHSLHSQLDDISGLGPKRKKALLTHFESIQNLREATIEEVASLDGMNKPLAEKVLAHLADNQSEVVTED
jgi:excinuclease ABC subunit C